MITKEDFLSKLSSITPEEVVELILENSKVKVIPIVDRYVPLKENN